MLFVDFRWLPTLHISFSLIFTDFHMFFIDAYWFPTSFICFLLIFNWFHKSLNCEFSLILTFFNDFQWFTQVFQWIQIIPRAAHRPPHWSWSAQRGCGGKLLQHVNSHMVRRGSYQGCKIYLKLFLGRPLESTKPLKFLWKAFPELSDASGRQPRGTMERPGTPPVCFKGSHGQPKRAQRRPKTVQVAAEMHKESYQNTVCNVFSQRCASEWRFKRFF